MNRLESKDLKQEQTEKVKKFLETWCVGQNKAINADLLADRTRINERQVRRIVAGLVCKGEPIASSIKNPSGYFVPRTRTEASACLGHLRSRIKSLYCHAAGLEKGLQKKFGDSQLSLGLDITYE